jgi:flagellar hook-associated protein FlgK
MLSALSIASSGMNAAQVNLSASAHNIANLSTEPFHREQVVQATAANGGVTTTLTQSADAGSSLETDMVGMLQAKNDFLANLAVFRRGDQMLGSLLDAVS